MGVFRPTWWQPPRPGFVFSAVAGAAVTIAMSAGAMTLSGQTPTLDKALGVGSGTLAFSGVAPTGVIAGSYTPATAALTLTGQAPTRLTSNVYAMGSGSLAFSGTTPSVTIGFVVLSPPSGTLTFDGGYIGIVFKGIDPGGLTLAGQTPVAAVGRVALMGGAAGSLTFTGRAPSLDFKPLIPSGTLTFTGQTANVLIGSSSAITITPQTGTMVFNGAAPTIFLEVVCLPQTGSLTFSGGLVSLYRLNPDTGSLTLSGQLPTLRQGFFPTIPSGSLTFSGLAPSAQQTVAANLIFRPNTGELTFGGATTGLLIAPVAWQSGGVRRIHGRHPIWKKR